MSVLGATFLLLHRSPWTVLETAPIVSSILGNGRIICWLNLVLNSNFNSERESYKVALADFDLILQWRQALNP